MAEAQWVFASRNFYNRNIGMFTKIEVEGKIQVGFKHELQQSVRINSQDRLYRAYGEGPKVDNDAITANNDSDGSIVDFSMSEDTTGNLFINGAGLVTSYGIFGAPGSGKTVLMLHLLEQVLALNKNQINKKYGALILDPKAALIHEITEIAKKTGRLDDLCIINTNLLNSSKNAVNVIDCAIEPYELGAILVLAGRSAGIDASDPFWFQEWSNLFASSINLLKAHAYLQTGLSGPSPITLCQLLDALFEIEDKDLLEGYEREKKIQRIARTVLKQLRQLPVSEQKDISIDIQQINRFYMQDYVGTIEAFITKAFGVFRRSKYACYSGNASHISKIPFYEDMVQNGRIVLVSISPSEPVLAKTLCTLVKCLFQRTVLSRGQNKYLLDSQRPLILACDEYSEIASEVPGQSMGDGQFLALARQYGCMAILATQSVNVLQASSLKESWRSVFSNFSAKFYMRLVDNETAEEATKLAGESEWRILSKGKSLGKDGVGTSKQNELRERKNLPTIVLTHCLKIGQSVVIGSLDGGATNPETSYITVPYTLTFHIVDKWFRTYCLDNTHEAIIKRKNNPNNQEAFQIVLNVHKKIAGESRLTAEKKWNNVRLDHKLTNLLGAQSHCKWTL